MIKSIIFYVLLAFVGALITTFIMYEIDKRKERDGILEEHPDKGFLEWCENEVKVAEGIERVFLTMDKDDTLALDGEDLEVAMHAIQAYKQALMLSITEERTKE